MATWRTEGGISTWAHPSGWTIRVWKDQSLVIDGPGGVNLFFDNEEVSGEPAGVFLTWEQPSWRAVRVWRALPRMDDTGLGGKDHEIPYNEAIKFVVPHEVLKEAVKTWRTLRKGIKSGADRIENPTPLNSNPAPVYIRTDPDAKCTWGRVIYRDGEDLFVLTPAGVRHYPIQSLWEPRLVPPGHPNYWRAHEAWRKALSSLP